MVNQMVFGHQGGRPLKLPFQGHVLLQARNRDGKGACILLNHLLRALLSSFFVLDTKGENARATWRARSGQKIHALDPFGIAMPWLHAMGITEQLPSRFNPLKHFTPRNLHAGAHALADALIVGEATHQGENQHFVDSAQQLTGLVIMWVKVAPVAYVADKDRDLCKVRDILADSEELKTHLHTMTLRPEIMGGLLGRLANSFINLHPEEQSSVFSTAQRQTYILDNPDIRSTLAAEGPGPEIDFSDWRREVMTVYLCMAATEMPVFKKWLRLILTSALNTLTAVFDPLKENVWFLLDEVAVLGHLNALEVATGLASGYGVTLINIFQDTSQLKELYRDRWGSFIGNSGVKAVFSVNDFDSAKYWSDTCGAHLEPTESTVSNTFGVQQTTTTGEAMRAMWTPTDIMFKFAQRKPFDEKPGVGKPNDEMLVLLQGAKPIVAERIPYWFDASLDGLWDDPRQPMPDLPPPPAPEPPPEPEPCVGGPYIRGPKPTRWTRAEWRSPANQNAPWRKAKVA